MKEDVKIPMLDLQPQIESHWGEFEAAFQRVLRSGHFILGPEEQAFEKECASYLGVKHAIGLNSGTDALYIALRSLGIGPGDEVITTPFTFFATAEAISHVGATPVFVDIEEDSFNINPELIKKSISSKTKAVIPVHLFGRPCDLDKIQYFADQYGLKIVEDCAQSFGASWKGVKVGSVGSFGCYSFFPTKNLNAFGDGGLLTTNDDELAEVAKMLRVHGSRRKYFNEAIGYNSRLDELHAALLRVKLPLIDRWNALRRAVAAEYIRLLAGVVGVMAPDMADGHVFHQFTVRIRNNKRSLVQDYLSNMGIQTMVYYPVPVHRLKIYQNSHSRTSCPISEMMAKEVLSLPIWPEITRLQLEAVVEKMCQSLN